MDNGCAKFFSDMDQESKKSIPLVHISLELQYSYPYPVSKSFPDFFLSVGKRVPYSSPVASRPF